MSEFETLVSKLLELKPELTREDVDAQIKVKKEKIGAGYLTDQGALFLIGSDHGISLAEPFKVEMSIKELYAGAKEITLEARVLNMSPVKELQKKDGSILYLRLITVYEDASSTVVVKLWGDQANQPGIENFKPGDLIKIIKAYVKSDNVGSATINTGSESSVELSNSESSIPNIDAITKDVSEAKEGDKDLVISGTVNGMINEMEYKDSRGNPRKALKMKIKGEIDSTMRVVLWGKDASSIPNMIPKSAKIKLLGVRIKQGNNQDMEIHGNDATIISIEERKGSDPIIVRILSISTNDDNNNKLVFAVDNEKNLYNIVDTINSTSVCVEGDVMECMPTKIHGNSITLEENSFVRKLTGENTIPTLTQIRTKIDQVKVDENYCIEAIILKAPERRDIQTKSGEIIALSEMYVEDDTNPIWVKGWRNQAKLIDKCKLGEIVSIVGVNARPGLEGKIELFITAFSKITKKD